MIALCKKCGTKVPEYRRKPYSVEKCPHCDNFLPFDQNTCDFCGMEVTPLTNGSLQSRHIVHLDETSSRQNACPNCGEAIDWNTDVVTIPPAPITRKTIPGLLILGILINAFISSATSVDSGITSEATTILEALTIPLLLFTLIFVVLSIAYSMMIYPMFFKSKSLFESPGVISFLNGLFGGMIFGILWTYNVSAGAKGVSYKVFATMNAVVLALIAVLIMMRLFTGGSLWIAGTEWI